MVELLRAVCPPVAFFGTRQRGLSAASSAQRPPARQCQRSRRPFRVSGLGREVLRPHEVRSEPQRPFLVPQRVNSGSTPGCLTHEAAVVGRFFFSARGREGGAAPRASLYLKGLTANHGQGC